MKEAILILTTHYENYLDVCLGFSRSKFHEEIYETSKDLKMKLSNCEITIPEYRIKNVELFESYLKMVGVDI